MDDEMQEPMTGEEPTETGGFTVCIRVEADGSMSVGVEPAEAPEVAAEEYGSFKPAADVKEALTMALELIKSGGDSGESAQSSFDEGFGGRGG